jgi:hypothetical protein
MTAHIHNARAVMVRATHVIDPAGTTEQEET